MEGMIWNTFKRKTGLKYKCLKIFHTAYIENIPNDLYGKYSIWKYQADLFTPHLCIEKSREESPRESFEYCKDLKFSFNSGLSVCAK